MTIFFLPGTHCADFLQNVLALDSGQNELPYRLCKPNLCMCGAQGLCKTGEEK